MSLQQHSDIVEQIDVKKDSDKKTVKNILSQLLPSSSTLILIHVSLKHLFMVLSCWLFWLIVTVFI